MSLAARRIAPKSAKASLKYHHVALEIQAGLARLREDDSYTDFEVVVQGRSFSCHKAVLAAVSDYFGAMFQSGMKETVTNQTTLDNISPEAFQVILELLYYRDGDTDPLNDRSDDELGELLRVADMFQMKFLSKICLNTFRNTMAAKNCVERWKIAKTSLSAELRQIAWSYIIGHFENVAKESVMLSLTYEEFLPIVSSEHLKVSEELLVWQVVSDWLEFDSPARADKLPELLKNVCLTEISLTLLAEDMAFDDRIRSDNVASKLVQTAIKFKNHPGQHGSTDLKFRSCMDKEQVSMLLGVPEDEDEDKEFAVGTVDMLCYSARDQKWKETATNLKTSEFASCVHGRKVYVSGGTGRHGDVMDAYCGDSDAWTLCPGKMTFPLMHHAMVANDANLYVIGGRTGGHGQTINGVVLQYNLDSQKWDIHGEIMAPVEYASAICANDKIYIMGGRLDTERPATAADSIQMYDTKSKAATILECQLPSPCAFSCAISRHDSMFVVTGNGEVVRLSGKKLESTLVATLPDFKGRTSFGATMKGDTLTVYRGSSDNDALLNTTNNVVIHVDVTSGKVWNGTTLSKGYSFYGAMNVVIDSRPLDMFD